MPPPTAREEIPALRLVKSSGPAEKVAQVIADEPSSGTFLDRNGDLVDSLYAAGIDFIKDDELIAASPCAPFEPRPAPVLSVLQRPPTPSHQGD